MKALAGGTDLLVQIKQRGAPVSPPETVDVPKSYFKGPTLEHDIARQAHLAAVAHHNGLAVIGEATGK